MRITVFTPTYNRAYILYVLYQSLQKQTFTDFEWLIVDDGSTDNTEELVQSWIENNNAFPIVYKKQENGGKHRAINKGVQVARGELFFIVDSDDHLPEIALERIDAVEKSIPKENKNDYIGICGLRGHNDGRIMGRTYSGSEFIDIPCVLREKFGIDGDKAEVVYTEILKKYPFPEYPGEKFISEGVVWYKIGCDGFKFRYFNEIVYVCDYLSDGLTLGGSDNFIKNPKGWGELIYQGTVAGVYSGVKHWWGYLSYYNTLKDKISFREIAKNLHVNIFKLRIGILGLKVFCKIYDRG